LDALGKPVRRPAAGLDGNPRMAETAARPKRLWVGRYHLQSRLGSGGQGTVYRAHDTALDRPVAVKFPKLSKLADPKAADRFRREAQALARLRHPNILAVHELGEHKNQMYLVTDLLVGGTLSEAVRERQWTPAEAAALIEKLARALHHIHEAGLIHRDIKPSNIFIEESGNPLIMDFGLVREIGGRTEATRTGDLLGTPGFVSPEQAGGPGELDARTDVYSLGVIFYLLLARRLPFVGTPLQIIRGSAERDPKPPGRYRPGIPSDIQAVCLQAIARDPTKRFRTALEFAEALSRRQAAPAFHRAVRRSEFKRKAFDLLERHWPYLVTGALVVLGAAWFAVWSAGHARPPDGPGPLVVAPGEKDRTTIPPPTDGGAKDGTKDKVPPPKVKQPPRVWPPVLTADPGKRAAEWVEDVRIHKALFQAKWRWVGVKAVWDRSAPDEELWAVGDLTLTGRSAADKPEVFRLFWKRSGGRWYCDPLTYLAVLMTSVVHEFSPEDAGAINALLLAEVRRLNSPRTGWMAFEQDRPGDPPAVEARAWLRSPTLKGNRSNNEPNWRVALPPDYPLPAEPIPIIPKFIDTVEMDGFLSDLIDKLLDKADKAWAYGEKLRAIRAVTALSAAAGFGQSGERKAGECRRRLLQWLPQVLEEAQPTAPERLLPDAEPRRLWRAVRAAGDAADWEVFCERVGKVADRWRGLSAAGGAAADALERWLKSAGP
jgi:hypothetical protein